VSSKQTVDVHAIVLVSKTKPVSATPPLPVNGIELSPTGS
jgi:hypothetical protein